MYQTIILNFRTGLIERLNHKEKDFTKTKFFPKYNLSEVEYMTKKELIKIKGIN